jgi:hypothetical protein
MTKLGETHDFKASDFVGLVEAHLGARLDFVICNTAVPSPEVIDKYRLEQAFPVEVDLTSLQGDRQIIAADVLGPGLPARHDPAKLGLLLAALL